MATAIDPAYLLSNYQNQTKTAGSNTLGKDDFLKILMTQLQNQDPTSPMQDKDFIAQMASFSTLEQITNLSDSINKFINVESQSQFFQASAMVGKTVTYLNGQNQETKAAIKSVSFKDGTTTYQLNDAANTAITAAQITKIE